MYGGGAPGRSPLDSRSRPGAVWCPEKSSLSKLTLCCASSPLVIAGVTGADVSMMFSSKLIRFFSLAGRHSSVSRHWIASFTVSGSSSERLLKRVQKVSTVLRESVEPSESSIDVNSRCEIVPLSSVSYCFRYSRQNFWRSASYGWYFALRMP